MGLIKFLSKLFFKSFYDEKWTCSSCGKEIFSGEYFCEECIKSFPYNDGFICEHCGRATSSPEEYCLTCKGQLVSFDRARSVFLYNGKIKTLVKKMKRIDNAYLTKVFAKELSKIYFRNLFTADFIVYVPMIAKRERKNGYNHAKSLAKELGELIEVEVKDILVKTKETKKQALLTAKERKDNLKGSFKIADKKAVKEKSVLLVDDVTTTGSTAETIAELLKKSGAKTVNVLTVASVKSKESI